MQFSCFEPQLSRLQFQLGHRSSDHPKKVLCFACFLSARPNAFQKILFRNCIVGFDIIRANTRACSDELTNQTIRDRILWNLSLRNQ